MKEQIISETKKLIRKHSLSFTLVDVASSLGISKKTIYKYFSGKEEIIKSIILEMKEESDQDQIKLLSNVRIPFPEKLKTLLIMIPSDYDLINSVTLNQLRRDFPDLYTLVGELYHQDWDRFYNLYQEGLDKEILKPMDLDFFKELYIVAITNLPEVSALSEYNHKELLTKTVNQLFSGIEFTK